MCQTCRPASHYHTPGVSSLRSCMRIWGKPTRQKMGRPWSIVSFFLLQGYFLESFNTLFEINSLPLAATMTSNNCEVDKARNVRVFALYLRICEFVLSVHQQKHPENKENTKDTI